MYGITVDITLACALDIISFTTITRQVIWT